MPTNYSHTLLGLGAAWVLAGLVHPGVRTALANGIRCMRRYPDLWRIPVLFGAAYALFNIAATLLLMARAGVDLAAWARTIEIAAIPPLERVAESSWSRAIESTAAIFNAFTTTFPLSAVFALAFLVNAGGTLGELFRALRRRFPRFGIILLLFLILCALAAIIKPFAYLLLPEITDRLPLSTALFAASLINLASFVFELLLGVLVLTVLMLMAYAWMRGMQFRRDKLLRVAMRRTAFVLKWSLVIAGLGTLLVAVPLATASMLPDTSAIAGWLFSFGANIGLPALAFFMLFYCAVQTTLVFHNESLRDAMRDSLAFVRANPLPVALFLAASAILHLAIEGARQFIFLRFGADSSLGAATGAALSLLNAVAAGWLIAAWVCLYKSLSTGRRDIAF